MHTGLLAGMRQFYAAEGLAGIYKGLSATIAKSASNQMLRFFIFNEYKRFVVGDENPLHGIPNAVIGLAEAEPHYAQRIAVGDFDADGQHRPLSSVHPPFAPPPDFL